MRERLTYANVMATLAVFLGLGGSAYAVAHINGKTINHRSIPANRIVKDSLTSTEINELLLSKVPTAGHADSATSATSAANASHATSATSAANATSATTAANAQNLGGLDPGSFERSSRIMFGRGPMQSNAAATILEWTEAGVRITTDGDTDPDLTVKLVNTSADSTHALDYAVFGQAPPASTLLPADGPVTLTSGGNVLQFVVSEKTAPPATRALSVTCFFDDVAAPSKRVSCFGLRSEA